MPLVSAEKFVQSARDNGYAVGGFNTNNLEWTQAILRAAEARNKLCSYPNLYGCSKIHGWLQSCS